MGRRGALLPLTFPARTWTSSPSLAEARQAAGNTPSLGELIGPRATQPLQAPFLHHEKHTDVFSLS